MKIFWGQGRLHLEPENEEERTALMVLWKGPAKTSFLEMSGKNSQDSTSELSEHVDHDPIT